MGQVCVQLARNAGAESICAIDPIEWRRNAALASGATDVVRPDDAPLADDPAHEGEFDVVIEAAGTQSALDLCGDLVAQHGRLNLVGYHQSDGGMRQVRVQQWNFKAIDVVNGHVRRKGEKMDALREGIRLMEAGVLDVGALIAEYPLPEIETAFRDLGERKEGLFKAILIP